MKFKVTKAEDHNFNSEVEINTLEELQEFWSRHSQKMGPWVVGHPDLIIGFDPPEIKIYDSWVE